MASNFKGNYSDLTGELTGHASVYHSEHFWLIGDGVVLEDVTAKVPGIDSEWIKALLLESSGTQREKRFIY